MTNLKHEIQRLRDGLIFHDSALEPPDAHTEKLLAAGDKQNAIRHCKEMYNECLRNRNPQRAAEFLAFVDQLQNETDPDLTKVGL